MNPRDCLTQRLQRYFQHPDRNHDYLVLGDRAAACRNLRDAFNWIGVPGSASTRADDDSVELFDVRLEEQVRTFQKEWQHPIVDGKVGPNTRRRLMNAILENGQIDVVSFRRLKRDFAHTVFISYAWADGSRVAKLEQWLSDHGITVQRDVNSFKPGSNIEENVWRSAASADKVIAVYSAHSRLGDWTNFEHYVSEEVERVIREPLLVYLRLDETPLKKHDSNRIAIDARGRTLRQVGMEIRKALGEPPEPNRVDYDENSPL